MAWTLDLLKSLTEHGVEFVVIGGVAAISHGSPRITEDLDICAPVNEKNARLIIRALQPSTPRWHQRPDLPIIREDSHFLVDIKNMYLKSDWGRLDVLSEVAGVGTYAEVRAQSIEMDFMGLRCRVLNLDALIAAKTAAGRTKDKIALPELHAIRRALQKRAGLPPKDV